MSDLKCLLNEKCVEYDKIYQKGRSDVIECIKSHLCVRDEDYDKPIISPKYLNDYIDMMIVDGFEKLKEKKNE